MVCLLTAKLFCTVHFQPKRNILAAIHERKKNGEPIRTEIFPCENEIQQNPSDTAQQLILGEQGKREGLSEPPPRFCHLPYLHSYKTL